MTQLINSKARQTWLVETLEQEGQLILTEVALTLGISKDTIRRDLILLEDKGALKRVRGGAIEAELQTPSFVNRAKRVEHWLKISAADMHTLLTNVHTLYLDGGTSVLNFTRALPYRFAGLAITPSPAVACALLELEIETLLVGGPIRPLGAIATGAAATRTIANCLADICVLGTCALDPLFGLTADDLEEAAIKQLMSRNSSKTLVLAQSTKLQRKARHKVIDCRAIDYLITDAAPSVQESYRAMGIHVLTS